VWPPVRAAGPSILRGVAKMREMAAEVLPDFNPAALSREDRLAWPEGALARSNHGRVKGWFFKAPGTNRLLSQPVEAVEGRGSKLTIGPNLLIQVDEDTMWDGRLDKGVWRWSLRAVD